jgi:4-hydroxythreonine-4-phosphate dehydrogenase
LSDYQPGVAVSCAAGELVLHLPLATACTAANSTPGSRVVALIDRATTALAAVNSPQWSRRQCKGIINDAGIAFTGHANIAARLGAPLPVMMLVAGTLRVALATTHLPLREVSAAIDRQRLVQILQILDRDLRRHWSIARPRIAVCGLNPHAGEGGHLGHEEQREIEPALRDARAAGLDVRPLPADTLFVPRNLRYRCGAGDVPDQGLPVLKHAGFGVGGQRDAGPADRAPPVDHGTRWRWQAPARRKPICGGAGSAMARPASLKRAQAIRPSISCTIRR